MRTPCFKTKSSQSSSVAKFFVLFVVGIVLARIDQSAAAEAAGNGAGSATHTNQSGIMLKGCFALGPFKQQMALPYELNDADKSAVNLACDILTAKMLKVDAATWRFLDTGFNDLPIEINNLISELVRLELSQADRLNGVDWTGLVAFKVEAIRTYDRRSLKWKEWGGLRDRFAVAHLKRVRGSWMCDWGELHRVKPSSMRKPAEVLKPQQPPAIAYQLNNGTSIKGEPVHFNTQGVVVRTATGSFAPRVAWTNFTQDSLRQLAKEAKAKGFIEPYLEENQPGSDPKVRPDTKSNPTQR